MSLAVSTAVGVAGIAFAVALGGKGSYGVERLHTVPSASRASRREEPSRLAEFESKAGEEIAARRAARAKAEAVAEAARAEAALCERVTPGVALDELFRRTADQRGKYHLDADESD